MQATSAGAVEGGKCTVTEGANKGRSGTYGKDDDGNLFCEGKGWATECEPGNRCKDAKKEASVFDYVLDGLAVTETEGLYQLPNDRVGIVRTTIDAATGEAVRVSVLPVDLFSVDDLRAADPNMAKALSAYLERSHHKA